MTDKGQVRIIVCTNEIMYKKDVQTLRTNQIFSYICTNNKNMKYPKDILEVHNEFELAGEKLLTEAKKHLDSTKIFNEQKVNLLKKFGFTKTKEVVETEQKIELKRKNAEIMEYILYYSKQYPFNKFITEESVMNICKKYGLVFGDVCDFTGFVPGEKLELISQF